MPALIKIFSTACPLIFNLSRSRLYKLHSKISRHVAHTPCTMFKTFFLFWIKPSDFCTKHIILTASRCNNPWRINYLMMQMKLIFLLMLMSIMLMHINRPRPANAFPEGQSLEYISKFPNKKQWTPCTLLIYFQYGLWLTCGLYVWMRCLSSGSILLVTNCLVV